MLINNNEVTSEKEITLNQNLSIENKLSVEKLIKNYLGADNTVNNKSVIHPEVEIELVPGHKPFNFSPRRLAYTEKIELQKLIDWIGSKERNIFLNSILRVRFIRLG